MTVAQATRLYRLSMEIYREIIENINCFTLITEYLRIYF